MGRSFGSPAGAPFGCGAGGSGMIGKFVSCFVVSALGATLALTSPALARGGGGVGGGGMHVGRHGGGTLALTSPALARGGGGMGGGGMHFGGMGGGMHFGGGGFAGAHFAHPGF